MSLAKDNTSLRDIQSSIDERNIAIDRVGVRAVKYPIQLRERDNGPQHTVGNFTLTVDLPREFKGTHMSRFMEVLSEHNKELSPATLPDVLKALRERLKSDSAHLTVNFTYFKAKPAPVTGKVGMMGYECGFEATDGDGDYDLRILITIPVTTLCPCSKEISEYGAHNQRGYVRLRVKPNKLVWFEDLIEMVEARASAPLYPLLKRPDEKFVTEQAYDNPRFVEDMVREVALALDQSEKFDAYEIEVENHESIHDHNAYAYLARP